MMFALPVQVDAGLDVGAVVEATLIECQMTHKEAWLACSIDGAQWSRSLKGQAPLDLWRLRHLPHRFWQVFLSRLAGALIRQWFDDLQVPYRMAKSALRKSEESERVS